MSRRLVALAIAAGIAVYFALDLGRYFTPEYFQAQRAAIEEFRAARPLLAALSFFALYVAVTGLSLPVAALLTLAAGAVFGLLWGTVIVSFAASAGATLAFLASRFLFREAVQRRFGDRLRAIDRGVRKEGAFYLFALRLAPPIPFFVINLVMGLTPIRTRTFYWVSQVGMLPGTLVYVNAGTQLADFRLSPALVGSFVLLGIFPLVAKRRSTRGRRAACSRAGASPRGSSATWS
jgi:uncharacterized membrane protein YdjX (TVP38/TMEM64 family)